MSSTRVIYSIDPQILSRFNAMFAPRERSKVVEKLMADTLAARERELEALALELESHPDFAQVRADALQWEATVGDGLDDAAP